MFQAHPKPPTELVSKSLKQNSNLPESPRQTGTFPSIAPQRPKIARGAAGPVALRRAHQPPGRPCSDVVRGDPLLLSVCELGPVLQKTRGKRKEKGPKPVVKTTWFTKWCLFDLNLFAGGLLDGLSLTSSFFRSCHRILFV